MLKLAELLLLCQCSVADGLMYFKGLIDMESFQSNLEKMEKLCNSNSCEGELDFKSILINNDYIPCAENSSGEFTNLGRSKVSRMVRKFQ